MFQTFQYLPMLFLISNLVTYVSLLPKQVFSGKYCLSCEEPYKSDWFVSENGRKSFKFQGVVCFNELPSHIREEVSYVRFKQKCRDHFYA